jgi:hypothetical protein
MYSIAMKLADLTEVVDLNDVRVIQLRGQLRLVQEHLHEARLLRQVRPNALDDDRLLEALEARLAGEEDLGHAADGDAVDQGVFAEPGRDLGAADGGDHQWRGFIPETALTR